MGVALLFFLVFLVYLPAILIVLTITFASARRSPRSKLAHNNIAAFVKGLGVTILWGTLLRVGTVFKSGEDGVRFSQAAFNEIMPVSMIVGLFACCLGLVWGNSGRLD